MPPFPCFPTIIIDILYIISMAKSRVKADKSGENIRKGCRYDLEASLNKVVEMSGMRWEGDRLSCHNLRLR